jgi:hypothetical protein
LTVWRRQLVSARTTAPSRGRRSTLPVLRVPVMTRRRVEQAWGRLPFDVYAATETAGITAEWQVHSGLHLFEDLVVTEVVDGDHRPVPPASRVRSSWSPYCSAGLSH